MGFEIKIEEKKNQSLLNRIADTRPLMRRLSLMGLSAIQKNVEKNIRPQNAPLTQAVKEGNNTLRDSNILRNSLTARHTDKVAEVGTNVPYAQIHNPPDGRRKTVIKPKKAKYLCLPAGPETRKLFGQYGWSPREVIAGLEAKGASVYRPYKKGSKVRADVIMAKEKGGKPQAIFILKKQITIPARPFMFLPDRVIEAMDRKIEEYYGAD